MIHKLEQVILDTSERSVYRNDKEVKLTKIEFDLLAYLLNHADTICPRQDIIDNVWGQRFQYDTGTLDVHLNSLRRKLHFTNTYPIETVRGVGLLLHSYKNTPRYKQNMDWATVFSTLLPDTLHTCSVSELIYTALTNHQTEIEQKQLRCHIRLDPFVNELTTDRDTFLALMDHALTAMLTCAEKGTMDIGTSLNITTFCISLSVRSANADFSLIDWIVAQRLAALLGMPMRCTQNEGRLKVEFHLLLSPA